MSEASPAPILDELEVCLASGNVHHRLKVLQRITDLFVAGSRRYSGAEIALFDDVLTRLAADIETHARARLARKVAALSAAPPRLIRQLAFDDAVPVATPVLIASPQLSDADLVENAATKSQDHLYAIAQRIKLSEAVTDVLVERGNSRVVRRVANNHGAQFSFKSYDKLVQHARTDRKLAMAVANRCDIPRQCFIKLLETASAEVRQRLEETNPAVAREIKETVAEVAGAMQREARDASRRHRLAERDARYLHQSRRLSEANIHAAARGQQFVKAAAMLAMLGPFPIDVVERALLDKAVEPMLILAKAAGCSWTTTKALLLMQSASRRLSVDALKLALTTFERLNQETARRVVKFYERRSGKAGEAEREETAVDPQRPATIPAEPVRASTPT